MISKGNSVDLSALKNSILKVLKNDSKAMPLRVLMYKVCQDLKNTFPECKHVDSGEFMDGLDILMKSHLVGKNAFDKYFIDYLDYEENGVEGTGYLEIDERTGNGYITVKSHPNEYKKSAYFVHRKNLGDAKSGDYVRFVELKILDRKKFSKFALIDARIKEVLSDPFKS